MSEDLTGVRAFGTWDAPVTDDAVWLDAVPTDMMCMHCRERFKDGDNGCIYPTGYAAHRECSLRAVVGGIGHLVDHALYCRTDPDAGLSFRQSAWLVWRHHAERRPVSGEELESIRQLEGVA